MRAWVSFHVSPWIRPKKTRVSLMVNSLYNARSCRRRQPDATGKTRAYGGKCSNISRTGQSQSCLDGRVLKQRGGST